MNDIAKINRRLKAAMKNFINHTDTSALVGILRLAREREAMLKAKSFEERKSNDKSSKN